MRAALCAILASMTLLSIGCHHNTCRNGGRNGGCQHCGNTGHAGHSGIGHSGIGHSGIGHSGIGHSGMPTHVARLPHGTMQQQMQGPGGPPSPTVAYPYYTTRAPRDFLMANPPGIGP